jgi:hypothetical protein
LRRKSAADPALPAMRIGDSLNGALCPQASGMERYVHGLHQQDNPARARRHPKKPILCMQLQLFWKRPFLPLIPGTALFRAHASGVRKSCLETSSGNLRNPRKTALRPAGFRHFRSETALEHSAVSQSQGDRAIN